MGDRVSAVGEWGRCARLTVVAWSGSKTKFSITTLRSGSLALANARTVRPVIDSTVSMNCAAVAI